MKKIKFLAVVSATLFVANAFAACGGLKDAFEDDKNIDKTKVQIYVGTYDGGYGQEYIKAWAKEFEELYKDEQFTLPNGETRTGVEIVPGVSSDYGAQITTTISNSNDEIIFGEAFDYYTLAKSGSILPITDMVEATSEFDNKTIASKMTSDQQAFYRVDGEYYGLPNYEAQYGLYYDRDLFEEKGYFFGKDGNLIAQKYQAAKDSGNLSVGPDGVPGNDDDGFPATIDQFFVMCDKMVGDGVIPVTYAGKLQFYYSQFLVSLWANFSGYDNMMVNFDYDGTANDIVSEIKADGSVVTKSETITPQTGYLMQKQAGKYYALQFTEKLLDGTKAYTTDVFDQAIGHIDNQDIFLKSRFPSGTAGANTKPIAMLIDSSWWYNEASETMSLMASTVSPACAANVRRIGLMPLPNATEGGKKATLFAANYPSVVVNKKTAEWKRPIVKKFLQFALSDEMLSLYSLTTNSAYSLKYELTETDEAKASYFLKSIMDAHNSADIVYPQSTSKIYRVSASPIAGSSELAWNTLINDNRRSSPSNTIGEQGVSAKTYFNGLSKYWDSETWTRRFSSGF